MAAVEATLAHCVVAFKSYNFSWLCYVFGSRININYIVKNPIYFEPFIMLNRVARMLVFETFTLKVCFGKLKILDQPSFRQGFFRNF